MLAATDSLFAWANYIESVLWCLIAAVVAVGGKSNTRFMLAGLLVVFGSSDVVEVQTGAWFRPWWLLTWKSVCVLGILVLGAREVRVFRASRRDSV